jgi:hypothetical protein
VLGKTLLRSKYHIHFSEFTIMAEYMPLTSNSPTEHDDEDYTVYTPPEPGNKLSNTQFQTSTNFLWLTILIAFTTISAAAALHVVVLSVHVDIKSLRSAHDITSALQMVLPSPNLDKGRNIMHQKNVKSKLLRSDSFLPLLTSPRAENEVSTVHGADKCSRARQSLPH